jgi:hypothetical protein
LIKDILELMESQLLEFMNQEKFLISIELFLPGEKNQKNME